MAGDIFARETRDTARHRGGSEFAADRETDAEGPSGVAANEARRRDSLCTSGIISPKALYPSTSNGHLSANCKDVRPRSRILRAVDLTERARKTGD